MNGVAASVFADFAQVKAVKKAKRNFPKVGIPDLSNGNVPRRRDGTKHSAPLNRHRLRSSV